MTKHSFPKYALVLLDSRIDKPLEYGVPVEFVESAKKGKRVEVPLRGQLKKGTIFALSTEKTVNTPLPINKILSNEEVVSEELFELALWMAKYYNTPLPQVLKVILPASVRKEIKPKEQLFVMRSQTKEEIREYCIKIRQKSLHQALILDILLKANKGVLLSKLLEEANCTRSPVDTLVKKGILTLTKVQSSHTSPLVDEEYFLTKSKKLNPEQAQALDKILISLNENRYETHLLLGITGSGKTEVYLQAIEAALKKGKSSIVLVPEISLTAQTIERFRTRFKEKIAVLHHRLSQGERSHAWEKILSGEAQIIIGARSAIFSPAKDLGLIILDEEHEASYKNSDEMPCYHAREIAVMRAKMSHCPVILGSATPSLESFYNACLGKYTLSRLQVRAETSQKAHVQIIDMKNEYERAKSYTNFSEALLKGIKERQQRGEQTILFLNRRGYHTTFFCQDCREPVTCNHCAMTLTYHAKADALSCHLCGFTHSPPPRSCPNCNSINPMKHKGVGTELLESSLKAILPDIRTLRIDADTTKHQGSHQKLLREFGTGKADVLIGTQMIAKGLHFPAVTLVGVINCDSGLHLPDFRASETTFQLITQVAGRSGRGFSSGEVILQTCMPENKTIQLAAAQDYEGFYQEESAARQLFDYPPFSNLVKLHFSGADERKTEAIAKAFREKLISFLSGNEEIYPVLPSSYAKVKDRYRFQCLIRGRNVYLIHQAIQKTVGFVKIPSSIKWIIDVNPLTQ